MNIAQQIDKAIATQAAAEAAIGDVIALEVNRLAEMLLDTHGIQRAKGLAIASEMLTTNVPGMMEKAGRRDAHTASLCARALSKVVVDEFGVMKQARIDAASGITRS